MQSPDVNTTIMSLRYQIDGMQKDLTVVKDQLREFEAGYVRSRENDLQLNAIRDAVRRVENDVSSVRQVLSKLEQMMRDLETAARERDNSLRDSLTKLITDQDIASNARDVAQTNKFNKWQIGMLIGILSTIALAILGVVGNLIYYWITNAH